ncbi:MAG: amidohydrolase family protein [Candidatus Omnitrophota bacterium]
MDKIIDFHTHAFPDKLAERAIKLLEGEGEIKAHLNGTVSALLSSMDRCGIEKSVICSIATKPAQFDSIFKWSRKISSERIIPFPSLHPDDPGIPDKVTRVKEAGFKGLKLHPYYQDFFIDEERMFPLYEAISKADLILLVHTGFDFAFSRVERADPLRTLKIHKRFPSLKLVTTHLGAWDQWAKVEEFLLGKSIYMEISFSLEFLPPEKAREIIRNHPEKYVLFGTDSPWTAQGKALSLFRKLNLGAEKEKLILEKNAANLLNSA